MHEYVSGLEKVFIKNANKEEAALAKREALRRIS